jgi:hypothetical protein
MEIVLKWNTYFTKNQYSSSILASFDFFINYIHIVLKKFVNMLYSYHSGIKSLQFF